MKLISQLNRKLFEIKNPFLQIAVGTSLGLVLGLSFNWFSPKHVFGAVVLIFLAFAVIKKSEIGLLGILVATSSILYEDQLPILSVGISLHFPDLLLLGLLGLAVLRILVEKKFKFIRTPLDLPLLFFVLAPIIATIIAFYNAPVETEFTRRALSYYLRIFSYYLTFFAVTNLVRERYQLNFLLKGILILAVIIALAIVLQFILGDSVRIISGRVETLETRGTTHENITRILPPGWPVILISFIVTLAIFVLEESKTLTRYWFVLLGFFAVALIFTFLRSYWTMLFVVYLAMLYLFEGKYRKKLMIAGVIAMLLATVILFLVLIQPDSRTAKLANAVFDRFSTVFDNSTFKGGDGSLNWRRIENGYAVSAIKSNLWVGLGFGFKYRPWDPGIDRPDPGGLHYDFRGHIHNGHFWILLQSGLLGYLSLLWLSLAFLIRGFKNWRYIPDYKLRSVVLGFSIAYLVVFIAAITNSSFTQWRWTPLLGIMMGVNEVILRLSHQEIQVV